MSYILDALKKSDRERKQGEIPSLQSIHANLPPSRRNRSTRGLKTALAVGFCSVIILAIGFWQWPSEKNQQTTDRPPIKEQSAQTPPAVPKTQPPPAEKITPQVIAPVQVVPQPAARTPERIQPQPEVVIEPAPLLQPAPLRSQTIPTAAKEPASTRPLLKELPADRQKKLPKITLAGHVYASQPSRRMIMINNRIVREGEVVGEDLRLVRITWDGVILRHIDTEFQMKLQ